MNSIDSKSAILVLLVISLTALPGTSLAQDEGDQQLARREAPEAPMQQALKRRQAPPVGL